MPTRVPAALVFVGDTVVATLRTIGDLQIAGKISVLAANRRGASLHANEERRAPRSAAKQPRASHGTKRGIFSRVARSCWASVHMKKSRGERA